MASVLKEMANVTGENHRAIELLKEETLQLKDAFCKIDSTAPFCKAPGGGDGKEGGSSNGSGED